VDPTFSRQSAQMWPLGCQTYAPAALYSPETFLCFWYLFLLEAEYTLGPVRPGKLGKRKKKSNDLIRISNPRPLACGIAPQPTVCTKGSNSSSATCRSLPTADNEAALSCPRQMKCTSIFMRGLFNLPNKGGNINSESLLK
jgi:hypothetical protein